MTIDPTTLTGSWSYPTQILFGPGNIKKLAARLPKDWA